MRWFLPLSLVWLCLNAVSPSAQAAPGDAKPRVHTVYSGQRLGSIAKRYNVSVEALCNANGLSETDRIQPGQKLLVPPRSDRDGSRTRAANQSLAAEKQPASPAPKSESPSKEGAPAER